jgi:hypothetical protein
MQFVRSLCVCVCVFVLCINMSVRLRISIYSQFLLKQTARDRHLLFVITGVRFNLVNLCTIKNNLT